MSAIRSFIAALAFILGVMALTFGAMGSVVLNEADFSPAEDYMPIWVELYNTAGDAADISGWLVQIIDPPWRGDIFVPQGTVVQGYEHLVLYGDARWVHGSGGVVILKNAADFEVDRTPFSKTTDRMSSHGAGTLTGKTQAEDPTGHTSGQPEVSRIFKGSPERFPKGVR